MRIIWSSFRHLFKGTLIEALKRQPDKWLRERWNSFILSNEDSIICSINRNTKLKLYKDSQLSQYIFQNIYEKEVKLFISNFLKNGDYFIDIGANIGLYSLIGSSRVKKNGRVYSFEPVTKNFERLLENILINKFKNIEPTKMAVSNNNEVLDINVSLEGFDAWDSFVKPFGWNNYTTEQVKTITLEEIFEKKVDYKRVKLIKIDVEGWELFVIQGGVKFLTLPDAPTLLIEFVDDNTSNAGYKCKEIHRLLEKFGYALYRLEERAIVFQGQIEEYDTNLIATKNLNNLLINLPHWTVKN